MNKARFLCFILMTISCQEPVQKKELPKTNPLDSLAEVIDSVSRNAGKKNNSISPGWIYTEEKDSAGPGKIYFASLDADNLLEFNFPDNGGALARIKLKNETGNNTVELSVSKGQFNCSFTDGMGMPVFFDEKPPLRFYCSGSSNGQSNTVIINAPDKFIACLLKAKKIAIEANFLGSGIRRMEFTSEKLKWEH